MSDHPRSNPQKLYLEDLALRAQTGDKAAFAEIYDQLVDSLYRFVLLKTNSVEAAQDIVSETFTKFWRYLSRYKAKNVRAYLFAIARNAIVDYYRTESKHISIDTCELIVDRKLSPELESVLKEQHQELLAALKKLPESYAEILQLRFIEELSIKETAKIIKKSGVVVRVTQYRALKKLKTLIQE